MQGKITFPIFQIVGYKNAGKTTLIKKLIQYFSKEGIRVGTLKHHGHGGEPAFVKDTDSYEHLEAGSIISAVQGEKMLQVTVNKTEELKFDEILKLYTFLPLDLLLIEGYKNEKYPKIVLLRDQADAQLLSTVSNIKAVGTWDTEKLHSTNYLHFSIQHIDTVLPDLAKMIKYK
ncbi:molybdopterin-guanine dinucleotide biosynthesis protein B [Virgibacillus alimentarius]|uniref:Molybdopterin-guanine dinucleotide biosynthesis protein B n=1 Tax=Virgibacillus alimentarius TaxID=698769 RepID=A0ABS4SBH9_9BACI|nr:MULTISPECIES: molybdopterin-guanine dinucleotide biosynthesis protein B [Virgibacillus]MBP2258244.1 molybdopterin-guanine dinucleotide biosynthesis protein B [Virgibacillus alimentarius]HLR65805.1 molybdopterin-guanine dinucleotide biosynthesis protein B [Virgibacillus sp.]